MPDGFSADEGTVIVTAQRREERLRDVPISISVLDAQDIGRIGAENIEDVARAVPNFTVATTGVLGTGQPAIRGIFSGAGSPTVGIYLDDTPIQIRSLGFSGNADLRTFDIERVEVLRGPQGTLFGANSMGGTVRFITRQPDLERLNTRAAAEVAFTSGGGISREAQAAVGAPLVEDRVGFRVTGYYRLDAGYVDRLDRATGAVAAPNVNDVSVLAFRGTLRALLGESVELSPGFSYQRMKRGDLPFFESSLGPHRQSNLHRQPGRDEFILPTLTVRADLGPVELTSVTSYLDRTDEQVTDYSLVFGELVLGGIMPGLVPEGGARSFTRVTQRSFTHETRLSSAPGGQLQWTVGAFFKQARLRLTQEVVEPGISKLVEGVFGAPVEAVFGVPLLPGGVSYRGTEKVHEDQIAGFGEVAWRFADSWEAIAGVRVSGSRLDLEVASEGPYAGDASLAPDRGAQRETPVTPRFGLNYRVGQHGLLYASVGKGFRVGGANPPVPTASCAQDLAAFGRSAAPVSFNSDRLWSYELGAKADLGGIYAGASLFRIDWSGIQQLISLPNCGFSYVDNLGAARSRGFEAELEGRPTEALRLAAGIGFVDARFQGTLLGGTPVAGGERSVIVEEGDRVPYVPRWTLRLAAEYRRPVGLSLKGYFRVGYQYSSDHKRAPSTRAAGYNPLTYRGEAYGNVLLRAGLEGRGWLVSVFAENLLNDRSVIFSSADFVPVTGAPLRQTTLRPRTIGIAVSLNY